jgi:4-aminobutyrate aminotransferase-like enzyme
MTEATVGTGARILEKQRTYVFPSVKPSYAQPIVMDRAQGVRVTDADGREYLDLFAGILTTSVGHCHPRVVGAVQRQLDKLGHTCTMYVTEPQADAAEKLAGIAPGRLSQTFFTNSGTEAIETAISMAQVYTGRSEIVALRYAYHGRSSLATNITAHASWRPLSTSIAGIKHARSPYRYRSGLGDVDDATLMEHFTDDLEEVIRTTTNGQPAAFIAETIQGVGGYVVPPAGYFQRAAEIIHHYGGVLISDEVQAGFGRTGDHWFGIEHWDTEPDIMVMAKGIANGFPVGATITRPEIASSWTGKTISTYGGNPMCMAAMNATLDVMAEEDVPARSAARGAQLAAALQELEDRYDWIGETRGMGLMQAIEIVKDSATRDPDPARTMALFEAAKDEGLLIGLGGHWGQVIRIGPSMLVTEDEMAEGLGMLANACATVDAMGST